MGYLLSVRCSILIKKNQSIKILLEDWLCFRVTSDMFRRGSQAPYSGNMSGRGEQAIPEDTAGQGGGLGFGNKWW